ncbi:hypothetical protein [Dendrosporobacter sp. 1207_IL3150]|uniref:hypothetical protein n=1 Tax=Dendrosporobacter sp. 1207_IL3150 TaxID=3084054 RepID=UPI002FDB002B
MKNKAELLELLKNLPEDKVPAAIESIKSLLTPAPQEPQPVKTVTEQALQELLTVVIASLTNSLYDLSVENDKAGAKIIANRLDFSRKKILEAWDVYKKK